MDAESLLLMARLYRETVNRLEVLDRAVQEGKQLQETLDFVRFVYWSGLIEVCKACPSPAPFKVDAPFLKWRCEDLQRKVQDRFRLHDGKPHIEETELNAINRKLDLIAGHLIKFSSPLTDKTQDVGKPAEPVFHVFQGGA